MRREAKNENDLPVGSLSPESVLNSPYLPLVG